MADLTVARLREVLNYNPETGEFRWIKKGKGRWRDKVGTLRPDGRIQICVDQQTYLAHRLAWFWTHGAWPEPQIDHVNRNPSENNYSNLREATGSQNTRNRGVGKRNTSGTLNVFWHKTKQKWKVQLLGRHVGYFADKEEAIRVAEELRKNWLA